MRSVYFVSTVALIFFLIGCGHQKKELLIDSFEGELNRETVDFGAGEGSLLSITACREFKVCGEQSLKLDYDLKPSGYMWASRGYNLDVKGAAKWEATPESIDWKRYNALSVQMYGGNLGGVVAFDVKDAGGEMWRFLLDDDFAGWREIICPLVEFFPRRDWQPESARRNEVLDFPIMSFQFEPRFPGKGVYYFDCIKLINADTRK